MRLIQKLQEVERQFKEGEISRAQMDKKVIGLMAVRSKKKNTTKKKRKTKKK